VCDQVDRSGQDGVARRWELGDARLTGVLWLEFADHVHGGLLG
jgi:hypothetical protein